MHLLDLGFFNLIEKYKIKNMTIAPQMPSSELLATTAKLTGSQGWSKLSEQMLSSSIHQAFVYSQ